MNTLFSSRAGITVVGGGAICRASWPLGKITLDGEALTLDTSLKSFRLRLSEIDRVRRGFLAVEIQHHAAGVPPCVRVWGVRLFYRLREAIRQHHLRVEVAG